MSNSGRMTNANTGTAAMALVGVVSLIIAGCSKPVPEGTPAEKRQAMQHFLERLEEVRANCDVETYLQNARVIRLIRANILDIEDIEKVTDDDAFTYKAAEKITEACAATDNILSRLAIPRNLGKKEYSVIATAIDHCVEGYNARWKYYDGQKEFLDGDQRPSEKAALLDLEFHSLSEIEQCESMIAQTAEKIGVDSALIFPVDQ